MQLFFLWHLRLFCSETESHESQTGLEHPLTAEDNVKLLALLSLSAWSTLCSENNVELLALLSLSSKFWDYRYAPHMPSSHSFQWKT